MACRTKQICRSQDNLAADVPKNNFTIGIIDDVSMTSLDFDWALSAEPEGTIMCKFWGLGSDGTVGANKTAIKIIGDHTDMYAQGYFSYDSKKSGGVTISDLRFGNKPIKSTYLVHMADYVACHNQAYLELYDMVKDLKPGGIFVLNTIWPKEEIEKHLPNYVKRVLAEKKAKFYTIDAYDIALNIGLGNRINMVMQAVFFALTKVIPIEDAVKYLKEGINKDYGKKGQKVLDMNYAAVDEGIKSFEAYEIPDEWLDLKAEEKQKGGRPAFIEDVLVASYARPGDTLSVDVTLRPWRREPIKKHFEIKQDYSIYDHYFV